MAPPALFSTEVMLPTFESPMASASVGAAVVRLFTIVPLLLRVPSVPVACKAAFVPLTIVLVSVTEPLEVTVQLPVDQDCPVPAAEIVPLPPPAHGVACAAPLPNIVTAAPATTTAPVARPTFARA